MVKKHAEKTDKGKTGRGAAFLACVFAFMTFAGVYYDFSAGGGLTLAGYAAGHLTETAVLLSGLAVGFYTLLRQVFRRLGRIAPAAGRVSQTRIMMIYLAVIFVSWLPYLIVCWPCSSYGWDYQWQLLQGAGVFPLSEHHPAAASYIFWLMYKAGYLLGGAAGGLFLTCLCQVLLMCFALAFALSTLRRVGCPRRMVTALLVFVSVCPVFPPHAVWLLKDTVFSALVVILFTIILNISFTAETDGMPERAVRIMCGPVSLAVTALAVSMFRNEAVLLVIWMLAALLVRMIRMKDKAWIRRAAAATASFAVLFCGWKVALRAADVCPTDISEALSVPGAQLAELICLYPEEVTEWDAEFLEQAYGTDLETIAVGCDDRIRDHVKPVGLAAGDLPDFAEIWLRHAVRHPDLYADTLLRGSAGYWWVFYDQTGSFVCPTPLYGPEDDFADEGRMRQQIRSVCGLTAKAFEYYGMDAEMTVGEYVSGKSAELEGMFSVRSALPSAREKLKKAMDALKAVPFLRLIFAPGLYTLIMLFALGCLRFQNGRAFSLLLPVTGILAANVLSPVNGYMRYFLPVALCAPLMLGLCFAQARLKNVTIHPPETSGGPKTIEKQKKPKGKEACISNYIGKGTRGGADSWGHGIQMQTCFASGKRQRTAPRNGNRPAAKNAGSTRPR